MIDFSKLTALTIPEGSVEKIECNGAVLWVKPGEPISSEPISLEVKKAITNTGNWLGEKNVGLAVFTGDGTPIKVTYGGLTKTVSTFNSSGGASVRFGTYQGVSDEVETPESGTLTIEGSCVAIKCPCITRINSWGKINRIEAEGFNNCSELDIVRIPEGVTKIGLRAFNGCTALTDVSIASTVEEIGNYAFRQCANLVAVRVDATTPPIAGTKIFYGTNANLQITVKAGCADTYKATNGWSTYASKIIEES